MKLWPLYNIQTSEKIRRSGFRVAMNSECINMYVYRKRQFIRRYRDIIGMYVKAISTVVSRKCCTYKKHKAVSYSTIKEGTLGVPYRQWISLLSGDIYKLYIMTNMSLILTKFSNLLAHIMVIWGGLGIQIPTDEERVLDFLTTTEMFLIVKKIFEQNMFNMDRLPVIMNCQLMILYPLCPQC